MFAKALRVLVILSFVVGAEVHAQAGPTYISGRITDVTFAGDQTMIRLDTGLPDNCIGSAYGWMIIRGEYKPMAAFVLGLWLRGDNTQVVVTVYTDGLVSGYCRVNQIDPVG